MSSELLSEDVIAHSSDRRSRWWDIAAAIFLFVAMFTAASRLDATEWAAGLSIIPYIAIFGTIAGLALGQSRFRPSIAAVIGFAYGVFIIGWQLGTLVNGDLAWADRTDAISSRVSMVIAQLTSHQTVTDSIVFIILMCTLFWLLSFLAGYVLVRHGNAWWAILPTGFAIFTIHSFDPLLARRALYLAIYIFFGLVLVARVTYLHRQRGWQETRTLMPPNLGLDFIRFAVIAVTVLVLVAWTVPALAKSVPAVVEASKPLRTSWQNVKHRWENAFSSLRSSVTVFSDAYGNNISLGQGSILSDMPVFTVTPPQDAPTDIRYYWRAGTYDSYTNGQWTDSIYNNEDFNPKSDPLKTPNFISRYQGTFSFDPATYVSTIFAPSQPFWVSANSKVHLAENSDGTVDIAAFRADNLIKPDQSYQVQASISNATINELKAAGTDYPDWVKERYLTVPDAVTDRTRKLASDIASVADNPYDKVIQITQYLRENIHYTQTIPAVPNGREPLDWFLFDFRQGFCNYYASAEVIMLRSIGIPARWAIGYAQGQRLDNGQFLVRQSDAHSWPEVYFPGYGWVEFEPTVAQPDIVRLIGSDASPAGPSTSDIEAELLRREQADAMKLRIEQSASSSPVAKTTNFWPILEWLAAIVLVGGLVVLAWRNRKRIHLPPVPIMLETVLVKMGIQPPKALHRWATRAALPQLSKSYLEINHALNRLGETPHPTQTPSERAEKLANVLPPAQIPANRLVIEYQHATFGQHEADSTSARKDGQEIRNLSLKAAMLMIVDSLRHPFRSKKKPLNPNLIR